MTALDLISILEDMPPNSEVYLGQNTELSYAAGQVVYVSNGTKKEVFIIGDLFEVIGE